MLNLSEQVGLNHEIVIFSCSAHLSSQINLIDFMAMGGLEVTVTTEDTIIR